MRILCWSWMHNKFSGGQEKRQFDDGLSSVCYRSAPYARKEEFDDWKKTLLSIGTLGNKDVKEKQEDKELAKNLNDLPELTTEELTKLREEITKLLNQKSASPAFGEVERVDPPWHWLMNCPSNCVEVDKTLTSEKCDDAEGDNSGNVSPNTLIRLNKVKHALLLRSSCKSIKKKSLSFLFKKTFSCGTSGFMPAPICSRHPDPIAESRMDKILRAILTRKIYPQASALTLTSEKKLLNNKPEERNPAGEEGEVARKDQGSRWVKTDSEYIVLEI